MLAINIFLFGPSQNDDLKRSQAAHPSARCFTPQAAMFFFVLLECNFVVGFGWLLWRLFLLHKHSMHTY